MLNNFVAAFVASLFWGKESKETEEKTRKASKWKIAIYGALLILVAVFFYKTYQVATIYNHIKISAIRASYDSSGVIADTIPQVFINNRFSSDIYKNDVMSSTNSFGSVKKSEFERYGGIWFEIYSHNHSPYVIKDNPQQSDLGFDPLMNLPFKDPDQMYAMSAYISSIPSLIPFFPSFDFDTGWINSDEDCYGRVIMNNLETNDLVFEKRVNQWDLEPKVSGSVNADGIKATEWVFTRNAATHDATYATLSFEMSSSFSNSLGFFTAADVSQYTHALSISSDCYIENLFLDYDIPIEVSSSSDRIHVGPYIIKVDGEFLSTFTNKRGLLLHVKLPTMANLQLIRSLILTTLLTALVALFGKNLFYFLRKWAIGYKKRNMLPFSQAKMINRNRIKNFKTILKLIALLFIASLFIISLIVLWGKQIYIPFNIFEYLDLIILAVILLLFVIIIFLYRHAKKTITNAQSEEPSNYPPTIFIHERDENEDYDRLVEEMHKESEITDTESELK